MLACSVLSLLSVRTVVGLFSRRVTITITAGVRLYGGRDVIGSRDCDQVVVVIGGGAAGGVYSQ